MATMAATRHHHHHLHDPFTCDHRGRFLTPSSSSTDPSSHLLLLDLLAVDDLACRFRAARQVPPPYERVLLDELLAVDLEFALAGVRLRGDACTAPCLRDEREIFLDLLHTDVEVDRRSPPPAGGGTVAWHDAYARGTGTCRHARNDRHCDDDEVMMHLLAVDEEVDRGKRHGEDAASDEYAIISSLHDVDREVGGAKARALVVEDLGCLLEVDRIMDGLHDLRSVEKSSVRAKEKTRGRQPIVHRRIQHASDADAATGGTHRHHRHLHDPHNTREDHRFLSSTIVDPSAHLLMDLLAVDQLVDSRASPPYERVLLDELLAVDLEFALADVRLRGDVCTAPCLRDEREILLDLLYTDVEVDRRSPPPAGGGTVAWHDAYARGTGTCRHARNDRHCDDDEVMMHLLAVDEEVDRGKRHGEDVASDEYAIISSLHDVDREVGGAKARALVVEDLGCLLEVDRMMDGLHDLRSVEESSVRAKEKTRGRQPIIHRRIQHASDADAATGGTHRHHRHLHDPHNAREDHRFLSSTIVDPSAHLLMDLLAVDQLVDSRASPPYERVLMDELLAVDLEFALADVRLRGDVCTAPCLRDEREIFLDLLYTDVEVDRRSPPPAGGGTVAWHDAYARGTGTCRHARNDRHCDDDEVMMHLLAVDEEVDRGKRQGEDAASDEYAIISSLHDVDREVGGAKARALVVEDLGCLLEVDRMMDRHR